MTKEVQIIIEGSEIGSVEGKVTTKAMGVYHKQNGKHFIQYDEIAEENGAMIKNMMKLATEQVTIRKNGTYNSHMIFDPYEATQAQYGTPFGSLSFHVHTSELIVTEAEDEILVVIRYILSDQEKQISRNQVSIRIASI